MSTSTSTVVSKNCIICSEEVNISSGEAQTETGSGSYLLSEEVCQRFCTLAGRYLNFNFKGVPSPPINLETTLSARTRNVSKSKGFVEVDKKNGLGNHTVCEDCCSIVGSFCDIFQDFSYLKLQLNWRIGEISEIMEKAEEIQNQLEIKDVKGGLFREKFLTCVKRIQRDFPQVSLSRSDCEMKTGNKSKVTQKWSEDTNNPEEGHILTSTSNQFPGNGGGRDRDPEVETIVSELQTPKPYVQPGSQKKRRVRVRRTRYSCRYCWERFQTMTSYQRHEKLHPEWEPYKCRFCEKTFGARDYLVLHERIHTGVKPFKCGICHQRFTQRSTCKTHQVKVHKVSNGVIIVTKDNKSLSCPRPRAEPGTSKKTTQALTGTAVAEAGASGGGSSIILPDVIMTPIPTPPEVPDPGRRPSIQSEFQGATGSLRKCRYCTKEFQCLTQLHHHEKRHLDFKPLECGFCRRPFASYEFLLSHERSHTTSNVTTANTKKTFYFLKPGTQAQNVKTEPNGNDSLNPPNVSTSTSTISRLIGNAPVTIATTMTTTTAANPDPPPHAKSNPQPSSSSYKCSFCPRTFGRVYTLRCHERMHTGEKPYKCAICTKRFAQWSNCAAHQRRVHSMAKAMIISDLTGSKLKTKTHRTRHCQQAQPRQPQPPSKSAVTLNVTPKESRTQSQAQASLQRVLKKENVPLPLPPPPAVTSTSIGSQNRIQLTPFKCHLCSKAFYSHVTLKLHQRVHTGEKPYTCAICGKRFALWSTCSKHQKKIHSLAKSMVISDLQRSKSKVCQRSKSQNQKQSKSKSTRKTKVKVRGSKRNNGNKRSLVFLCKVCGMGFTFQSNLNRHQRTIHGMTKEVIDQSRRLENPTVDNQKVPNMAPAQPLPVKIFKQTQKKKFRFNCRYCGKPCISKWELQNHEDIHTKAKAFHCKICGKGFRLKSTLTQHEITHSGEKPFQCRICNKNFNNRSNCWKHQKGIHGAKKSNIINNSVENAAKSRASGNQQENVQNFVDSGGHHDDEDEWVEIIDPEEGFEVRNGPTSGANLILPGIDINANGFVEEEMDSD